MNTTKPENPIHQKANGKWAFWNEIWSEEIGDYFTEQGATNALIEYTKTQLRSEHETT